MSTILRVKRRFDQEPLDTLVIAGKRRKIEASKSAESDLSHTEVLKFAGTVNNQEDDVVEHVKQNLTKDQLKVNYKQHPVDVVNKARERAKEVSRENRYKVVKCFRAIDGEVSEDKDETVTTVIDVEPSELSTDEKTEALDETNVGYVYDLYYTESKGEIVYDDNVVVQGFSNEIVFEDCNESNARLEEGYSSEDSNAESYYKNDYPDSDHSENSIREDDIRVAVGKLKIGDESSDLSSEDDLAYYVEQDDVDFYGYKYAKYKARVKKELGESDSDREKSADDEFFDHEGNESDDDN